MNRGGKRSNSGRKKIEGKQVKFILEYSVLKIICQNFEGNTISEKIKKCIEKGLKND